jgi:predicted transposase/invertase (TIGR01784 family)
MTMDFLPPKSDIVFKLLFGDKRNGDLLRDFLKSIVKLPDDEFSKIAIVDPHLLRKHPDKKLGILDLKVKTKSGKIIHVEIQLSGLPQMRERIVFYDAGLITDQIDTGEDYSLIKRVITILIVDYILIPDTPRYHNRFRLYDPASGMEFSDLIEIDTLELPKLPKMADNYLWHWLRFLRAESMEDLDMVAQASPQLKKVVVKLLKLSQDERARMIYEAEVKEQRDNRARLRGALEQGLAEGKAEGEIKGRISGKHEKALEIARKLLKRNMPINTIVEDTGLSREEIEKLRS